jgi:hypothetical protein
VRLSRYLPPRLQFGLSWCQLLTLSFGRQEQRLPELDRLLVQLQLLRQAQLPLWLHRQLALVWHRLQLL